MIHLLLFMLILFQTQSLLAAQPRTLTCNFDGDKTGPGRRCIAVDKGYETRRREDNYGTFGQDVWPQCL